MASLTLWQRRMQRADLERLGAVCASPEELRAAAALVEEHLPPPPPIHPLCLPPQRRHLDSLWSALPVGTYRPISFAPDQDEPCVVAELCCGAFLPAHPHDLVKREPLVEGLSASSLDAVWQAAVRVVHAASVHFRPDDGSSPRLVPDDDDGDGDGDGDGDSDSGDGDSNCECDSGDDGGDGDCECDSGDDRVRTRKRPRTPPSARCPCLLQLPCYDGVQQAVALRGARPGSGAVLLILDAAVRPCANPHNQALLVAAGSTHAQAARLAARAVGEYNRRAGGGLASVRFALTEGNDSTRTSWTPLGHTPHPAARAVAAALCRARLTSLEIPWPPPCSLCAAQ